MEIFERLRKLLQIERREDLEQYRQKVLRTPLGERKKKGFTWYPVDLLRSEIGTGEKFYISLERKSNLGENHGFQVGGMVSVFQNTGEGRKHPNLPGVISSLWKDSMKVALNVEELPDWLEDGHLGVDQLFDGFSYDEMDFALEKAGGALQGRLFELRQVLLGQRPANFATEGVPGFVPFAHLNNSQNCAVESVLRAQDVALIHGPPGTGKTTTLVAAVQLTLEREQQVLVTAPSNTAVDLLTERLAAQGLKVLRIGNPARVSEELVQHSLDAKIAMHQDYNFLKKMRKQAEEYRQMALKYKRRFGREEREQRRLLLAEARKVLAEAEYLEQYIVRQLLEEAQVICATLVGSVNKYIRHLSFRTVFIDEAAQALEPACWIPILKADRVVFAGDHQQLPPTVKSYEAAQQGLAETLFEKCMRRQPAASTMLQVQYRMHRHIMHYSNERFYDNGLLAHESVANHLLDVNPDFPLLSSPFTFIDTAGCGFAEQENPENLSKFNEGEAEVLLKHLDALFACIYQQAKHLLTESFRIGIISPYNAQVALIKEKLLEWPDLADFQEFINVNSVDGFQGQEREAIYISLVRSNDKGRIGFLSDIRRMNVAMTRAKKKLVIVGDSATLGNHPFYDGLLNFSQANDAWISAWEADNFRAGF